jgi:DNA-directed RNA polymerase specialized sigma24 family protein
MARSSAMRRRADEGGGPTQAALASWCPDGRTEWGTIWGGCTWRSRAWGIPPGWSAGDWSEEIQAEALAAVCQALHDYDATRGVPLVAFVRERVEFGMRARYRKEWAHSVHCGCELPSDGGEDRSDAPSSTRQAYEALQGPLARLSEPDRRLIEHLFWGRRTEAELASELGISQSAVSRRKQAIILVLRRSLGNRDEKMEESRS